VFTLLWCAGFTRSAEKFIINHTVLREKLASMLRQLEKDPFQPHLKYHHLRENFTGIQSVSITYGYRITLTVVVSDKKIILLDIGNQYEVFW
jgi:mRNA-degrading endonuclease YafQ of YafQ-DinJ toxin-antitoxin module